MATGGNLVNTSSLEVFPGLRAPNMDAILVIGPGSHLAFNASVHFPPVFDLGYLGLPGAFLVGPPQGG